jgi:hypothetical protein
MSVPALVRNAAALACDQPLLLRIHCGESARLLWLGGF